MEETYGSCIHTAREGTIRRVCCTCPGERLRATAHFNPRQPQRTGRDMREFLLWATVPMSHQTMVGMVVNSRRGVQWLPAWAGGWGWASSRDSALNIKMVGSSSRYPRHRRAQSILCWLHAQPRLADLVPPSAHPCSHAGKRSPGRIKAQKACQAGRQGPREAVCGREPHPAIPARGRVSTAIEQRRSSRYKCVMVATCTSAHVQRGL